MSTGSAAGSTNSPSKVFLKKEKFRKFQKAQSLNLPCADNNLHSISIVLGIISNVEIIHGTQEDVRRLHANTDGPGTQG